MSYFPPYIDTEGIHIPVYKDVLASLIADYKGIFGEDVNLEEGTMDYQLLSTFARYLDDYSTVAVQAYNARNPNYATGDSLDVLLELNGVKRKPATRSLLKLKLTGTANSTVPAGSQAIDEDGEIWTIPDDGDCTLDANGDGEAWFYCETYGPIAPDVGTVTGIYTPLPNWYTVTNEGTVDDDNLGTDDESDADYRKRRNENLKLRKNGTVDSIYSAVMDLDGVDSVSVYENNTGETDDNGVTAHSIAVVVSGGDDDQIAQTIWDTKAPGVATFSDSTIVNTDGPCYTEKTITDAQGHSYSVHFTKARDYIIQAMTITVTKLDGYDSTTMDTKIKNAVVDDILSLSIGSGWDVTMAYRDIYNALAEDKYPVIINSIVMTTKVGSTVTSNVTSISDLMYYDKLTIQQSAITISEYSP